MTLRFIARYMWLSYGVDITWVLKWKESSTLRFLDSQIHVLRRRITIRILDYGDYSYVP